MGLSTWTKEDVDTLVKMWKAGISSNKIADKLNRRRSAVTQFICRNRVKLGLKKRGHDFGGRPRRGTFDQQWHGPVPCGHWMITKPWRKQA